ncbi:MAG: methyl-accepting chemotaxis protein, partial [Bdellovibrionales bacterium]
MKNWSIKKKLIFLSAVLLAVTLLNGGVQQYGNTQIYNMLVKTDEVYLPEAGFAAKADMEHENIRAIAYRALTINEKSDDAVKKEIANEFKKAAEDINKYLDEVGKLNISAETRAELESSQAQVKLYVAACEEIVGLAVAGRKVQASERIDTFDKAYFALAEKLDAFGHLVDKKVEEARVTGEEIAIKFKLVGIVVVFFGVITGILLALWIVSDLLKTLNNIVGRLKNSSGEVSSASSRSASSATELSEAATEQAASLQETMASVEQISAMVNQNAESAGKAQLAVEKNKVATEDGSNSVNDMMTAINEIKGTNDQILTQMASSNKEFAEIVKIITEIGEKTKV